MNKIKLLPFLLGAITLQVHGADTYNTSTGTLTIPLVKVDSTYYSNVVINVGSVISVGSASSADLSYDTYSAGTGQLTIPIVNVGTTPYYNVVITVAGVVSVGGSCATLAACSSSTSTTSTTNPSLYYAPATYAANILTSYSPGSLTATTAFTARNRYLISDNSSQSSASNYLQIGSTYNATTGYGVETGNISDSSTYNTYLQKLIQVSTDSSGYFRFDSYLHPNNSIDFDATDNNILKFRNNFGKVNTFYGYVTFSYNSSTKTLQAKKRYKYSYTTTANTNGTSTNTASFTEDTAFTAADYYVNLSNGVYKLVASSAFATPFYLYNSPLNLDVPTFMNPNQVTMVTNSAAPFLTKTTVTATEGTSGNIYRQVNATYRNQVATPGSDATTKTHADAMLATIKSTVEAAGEKLRYSTELYSAYRDATLTTKLTSDSISDGTPGQNLVPYVYFTNEKDSSGVYHPFMIVVTYGNQASPNGLKDIPHPPGESGVQYPSARVTRFSNLENYILAIPMKDYGQVTNVTDNIITKNLWTERTTSTLSANVYTYADIADNGLLINGAVIFPTYNNVLVPSHLAGELSASGCHVGQGGGGPHCHSDAYQSGFNMGFYADADYLNKTHPPLIGFGYDGIALFGRYRTSDTGLLGYSTSLDDFGAHNHDNIGYHYHAHVVNNHKPELMTTTSTLYCLMKGAYIGKTNNIPYFRTDGSSRLDTNKYLGGTTQ